MRKFTNLLAAALAILIVQMAVLAQTTGSIAGAVTDPNGAVVPGAAVKVKGEAGQEFTATTSDNGVFRVPSVQNGVYTVTITANGFKTLTLTNVKVDVGTPVTVDGKLEIGNVGEVVEVASGGEILQTQTATVASTVTGRQITETPIASRDALDLVNLMPGVNTVGAPRRSSINGLPKGAISITIDGVDVQDNLLRSSDGYFTYVRPRVDAIEEVTVSTAATGADTGGDGAVQIKFVTRRGTNDYSGSAFYQRRHESLNSNYWYNNRDKLARSKMRLQQYGASFGGPIPFLGFGEGVKAFDSGKDKRFFFVNYEEFRLPESLARTRTILTTQAQQGIFAYIGTTPGTGLSAGCTAVTATTQRCERDLLSIASTAGFLGTPDPTVRALLARIRTATASDGTITPVVGATTLTTENYNFAPQGNTLRKFLAARFDFNITKNHSLEFVMNRQDFGGAKDFLNSQDERFPGFPFYTQISDRDSYSTAVRSTLGQSMVNEFRVAMGRGYSQFSPGISTGDFAYTGGFSLGIDAAGATTPYSRNSYSARTSPTDDITDSLTWTHGSHTFNFGGQVKRIRLVDTATNRIVPTVSFGLDASGASATETALRNAFSATTLPGATTAQLDSARALYATLIGRVTGYTATAYLNDAGQYVLDGPQTRTDKQFTYGLFGQDSWKLRSNLTLNYGLRWQPQGAYIITSANYGQLASFDDVYGLSGVGNVFKPGTLTGRVPTVVGVPPGTAAYKADYKNFAPSVGIVWSPNFGGKGFFSRLVGANGTSVLRAGYSVAMVREGTALIGSLLGANPGGNLPATRSVALGNLSIGTNLRDLNNPNLVAPPFSATPSYPITLTTATSANAFDPNLKTGTVHSFSAGYQRELNRNTVLEIRYVGNRGYDLYRQHNINELNVVENGLAAEYRLAQANLAANVAANRCQTGVTAANCQYNIAYFGPGTGTNPLPITSAYLLGINTAAAQNIAVYGNTGATAAQITAAANFRSTTFTTSLNPNAASAIAFGTALEGAAARRTNALNAGLAPNFFFVNPTVATAGAFVLDNSARSWYEGGVIEVRRRLSAGLRVGANYTFARAQSDSFQANSDNFATFTQRPGGQDLLKGVAVFDIRHAFKLDATYDLPFGRGRTFFGGSSRIMDAIIGGFSFAPVLRWQSGSPIQIGNAQLVGMTVKDLQRMVKIRKEADAVYWLPDDIILNSRRAFGTDISTPTGYGALGVPQGRYIAPAGIGNCIASYTGQCGYANLVIYGPSFFKLDASLAKVLKLGEKRQLEFRLTSLDVLNHPNFRVGGWAGDAVTSGCCTATFGQLGAGSAYQDVSTTNDPGGRLVDLMIRLKF